MCLVIPSPTISFICYDFVVFVYLFQIIFTSFSGFVGSTAAPSSDIMTRSDVFPSGSLAPNGGGKNFHK